MYTRAHTYCLIVSYTHSVTSTNPLVHLQLPEVSGHGLQARGGSAVVVVAIRSVARDDASIAEDLHVVQREQCVPLGGQLLLPAFDHVHHRDLATELLR